MLGTFEIEVRSGIEIGHMERVDEKLEGEVSLNNSFISCFNNQGKTISQLKLCCNFLPICCKQ